ncbi:MAG: hypothetical protein ACK5VJ_00480 [Pseudomonadota bacterium]|jgi:hypothetical protein
MSRPTRQWTLGELREECTVEVGDCWEWQRSMSGEKGNQPQISVGRKPQSAFRLAYALSKGHKGVGELPQGLQVWRTCCNWRCINPKHLAAGSQKDKQVALAKLGVYQQDAAARLRSRHRAGRKLTLHDARRIRASADPVKVIAAREGVSTATVIGIRSGRNWREAPRSNDPLSALAAAWQVRPSQASTELTDDEERAA